MSVLQDSRTQLKFIIGVCELFSPSTSIWLDVWDSKSGNECSHTCGAHAQTHVKVPKAIGYS